MQDEVIIRDYLIDVEAELNEAVHEDPPRSTNGDQVRSFISHPQLNQLRQYSSPLFRFTVKTRNYPLLPQTFSSQKLLPYFRHLCLKLPNLYACFHRVCFRLLSVAFDTSCEKLLT